jgi:tetratricopeptide (TPR) repeat protein
MYSFQHSAAIRLALGGSCCVLLATACYQTLRLSWTVDPARGEEAYSPGRRVAANPADWRAWIQLGVTAEAAGDQARAEFDYRQAAAANRQFQPAWTLANYFFRRENRAGFDLWAGRSLRMSYGDPRPLFDLCWREEPSPDLVLRAAGDRRDLLRLYLAYLTSDGKLDAAGATARRLLPLAEPEDLPNLAAYCGRVLETGTADGALEVWNELCRRRLLPYGMLAPARGQSLTNGGFTAAPSSLGFDWRIIPWAGLSAVALPATLRFEFSGGQPESCELLNQWLPVEPSRAYRLGYDYRTFGTGSGAGLRWRVYTAVGGAELSGASPQLSSPDWARQETAFATGPDCRLARLVLEYRKAPEAARLEGSLWLRHITLD